MKYVAQWNYRSGLGVLSEGDIVEMSPEEAQRFNNDSPGVLVEEKLKPANRMQTKGKARE